MANDTNMTTPNAIHNLLYGIYEHTSELQSHSHLVCRVTGVQTCALSSEEHTSELQSHSHLLCRLLLEKKQHPVRTHLERQPRRLGAAHHGGGRRHLFFFLMIRRPPRSTLFPPTPPSR